MSASSEDDGSVIEEQLDSVSPFELAALGGGTKREITLDEISTHFRRSFPEAASRLGICQTSLKKLCRKYGISRWPQRKLKGIDKKIASLKTELSYLDWSKSSSDAEKVLGLTDETRDIILGIFFSGFMRVVVDIFWIRWPGC